MQEQHFGINILGPTKEIVPDITCPALPKSHRPNAHSSSCAERLARRKIEKCCRDCKGIVDAPKPKKRHEGGLIVETPSSTPCACGNKTELGFQHCPKCKSEKEIKRKEYRKEWYRKKRSTTPKLCGICKVELEEKKYKFCASCKPEAERLQIIRTSERSILRRKQRKT